MFFVFEKKSTLYMTTINNYKKKQRKNADSGNVCAVVTQKGM
jgi:hypothetical protein